MDSAVISLGLIIFVAPMGMQACFPRLFLRRLLAPNGIPVAPDCAYGRLY
jgi:hypothetical protein